VHWKTVIKWKRDIKRRGYIISVLSDLKKISENLSKLIFPIPCIRHTALVKTTLLPLGLCGRHINI
jgi:hypothetical protein